MTSATPRALTPLEYHVLLSLVGGAQHGYAIKDLVAAESSRTLEPRAGTLYRVIARLMSLGWVVEAKPDGQIEPHPGLARRYYGLAALGRKALATEARRLKETAAVAEKRLGVARGR